MIHVRAGRGRNSRNVMGRMYNRLFVTGFLVGIGIFLSPPAFAVDTMVLSPELLPEYLVQQRATQLLQPTAENPIHVSPFTEENMPQRSFVRILYTSRYPVPITVGPLQGESVYAVMPPGESRYAVLPITQSPAWRRNQLGIVARVYWLDNHPPEILGMGTADSDQTRGIRHYFAQPFVPVVLGANAINTIDPYRFAGISVTLLLGGMLLIVSFILSSGRLTWMQASATAGTMIILLYAGRFLTDVIRIEWHDLASWHQTGTHNEMGYTNAIAEVLTQELQDGEKVFVCTRNATPLRFLLFPHAVLTEAAQWETATYAVIASVWSEASATYSCAGSASRQGSVVHLFPTGEAIIRFTDHP